MVKVSANARGGSFYAGLMSQLIIANRMTQDSDTNSCSIHGHSLTFSNPGTKYFGSSGAKN